MRHGIARRSGPGLIEVTVRRDGEMLLLTVTDDGVGFNPDLRHADLVTGLANSRDRLHTLYGDRASLAIARNSTRGMTVTVRLPWHEVTPDEPRANG